MSLDFKEVILNAGYILSLSNYVALSKPFNFLRLQVLSCKMGTRTNLMGLDGVSSESMTQPLAWFLV